jgi:hypothetical protein
MQQIQFQILSEEHDGIVKDWFRAHVAEERLAKWGPPDTSRNPVSDVCRQLSTPGLYGKRPKLGHLDDKNQPLIGPDGILDNAGWAPKLQRAQYFALGIGDYFIRPAVVDGELSLRMVAPHNIFTVGNPDAPDRALQLWELRLRWWASLDEDGKPGGSWIYAWDKYDISDPDAPTYTIHALTGGMAGHDVSDRFLHDGSGEAFQPVSGAAYPWRRKNGEPVIPYARYRSIDGGDPWNHLDKRGAFRGTLNSILYASYAGHCARDATGSMVIIGGLMPWGGDVIDAGEAAPTGGEGAGGDSGYSAVQITPGTILYHRVENGTQPFVKEVGPGARLMEVAQFARDYEIQIAMEWGLNPADVTREHANPTSGAALAISNKGKREFSEQVEPVFRRSDLQLVALCAIECRLAGMGDFDDAGYAIAYHRMERSEGERTADRADADWDLTHGHASEVEVYQRRHPGTTVEQALAALTTAAVQKALLQKSIDAALEEEGVADTAATAGAAGGNDEALNGAQVKSVMDILERVSDGKLTAPAADQLLVVAFPSISLAEAASITAGAIPGGSLPTNPPTSGGNDPALSAEIAAFIAEISAA